MKRSLARHHVAWMVGVAALVGAAVLLFVFVETGSDDDSGGSDAGDVDMAFAVQMVPHHQAAVEMARIAQRRADNEQIEALASDIIRTQTAEIATLEAASDRLDGGSSGQPADGGGRMHGPMGQMMGSGALGLSMAEMGMAHDVDELRAAKQFDREFIDMMIPHHQGAIRMARVQLTRGEDPELKRLSRAIIAAQSKEIAEMNRWRQEWYGEPSPAGGVPGANGDADGRGMMDGGHMDGGHMDGGQMDDRMGPGWHN